MGKLTIITPSYRIQNLKNMYDTMNFDYIDEWIIVYDGKRVHENPHVFQHDKIKEYLISGDGIEGNPQRNYGISHISNEDTYIYFLDDDNIIHPELYNLLDTVEPNKFYTFDQNRNNNNYILPGNNINLRCIDTAMFICHYSLVKDIFWDNHAMCADGVYIIECYEKNKNSHVYINKTMAYWNKLRR